MPFSLSSYEGDRLLAELAGQGRSFRSALTAFRDAGGAAGTSEFNAAFRLYIPRAAAAALRELAQGEHLSRARIPTGLPYGPKQFIAFRFSYNINTPDPLNPGAVLVGMRRLTLLEESVPTYSELYDKARSALEEGMGTDRERYHDINIDSLALDEVLRP